MVEHIRAAFHTGKIEETVMGEVDDGRTSVTASKTIEKAASPVNA
jgi:hypothetical protein